jgi:uncharacterized protein
MKGHWLDSNLLIRFITQDVPEKAERVLKLFQKSQKSNLELALQPLVVAEVVYILRAHYKYGYPEIEDILLKIIKNVPLQLTDASNVELALALCTQYNIDFEDAYLQALAQENQYGVFSFDTVALKRLGASWSQP